MRAARLLFATTLAGVALTAAPAIAEAPRSSFASDPPGRASEKHWFFDVVVDKGDLRLVRAKPVTLKRPAPTARMLGRFALELWIGKELLDRVRFSPPLMGDDAEGRKKRLFARPSLDRVTTAFQVNLADHPRATWVKLVDRQTGKTTKFWWPPEPDGRLVPMGVPAGVVAGPLPKAAPPEKRGAPTAAPPKKRKK